MAHVTLGVVPKIELAPDEYSIMRKAMRGELIRDEDKAAARELIDKLDTLCVAQSDDINRKMKHRVGK